MEKYKIVANEFAISNLGGDDSQYISLMSEDILDNRDTDDNKFPTELGLLPLRNTVLFPGVIAPITIGREKSLSLIREVYRRKGYLGAVAQTDHNIEDPTATDLHKTGTLARIVKILQLPDETVTVIIHGVKRFCWNKVIMEDPYIMATINILEDIPPTQEVQKEFDAIISTLRDLSLKIIQFSSHIPPELSFAIRNIENPIFLINYVSANIDIQVPDKQNLLEINDLKDRGMQLVQHLIKEEQLVQIKSDIQTKVKLDLDKQHREYLLHQHMKTIQDELGTGMGESEIKNMEETAKTKKWNKEVEAVFKKELKKMQRLHPASGEFSVQLNYLQTMLEIPWNEYTEDNFDLNRAKEILDRDHHGLDKVKERILEHLAVLKLRGDLKSPILCLYGAPGVGKTSLGKSVAEALGRKYVRMSLGGLHDEAEIRGHRKTYIGSMPGRIIQNIKKAGAANPVFILDEIDKIGKSFHGDPAAALLEVLDPEQNNTFHDNFLDLDFDLSKVLFIATANILNTISPPLLDRMELIDVSGYIVEEKVEIAMRHLIPKQSELHGVPADTITLSKQNLVFIIEHYTRESGVRELDKLIARLFRKIALKIATEADINKNITDDDIREYLGIEKFNKDRWDDEEFTGVVTGLAWTAAGGEILYVESCLSKGKGVLKVTGNLGEVMKESAILALEYIKSHAQEFGLENTKFDQINAHVHVPEGAIPKDGPSAGITIVTSLVSTFTKRRMKPRIAMTGEITLRGKVLPVGGIKEKILAAKRAGVNQIILSAENKKDINDIKEMYIEGVTFHYVNSIKEVVKLALKED
ncbi:MAG: endopeptidase La [Marinilabiliaceae bacterium]|nr:endopeptidase La [Marinilabiliaceae bacterium]